MAVKTIILKGQGIAKEADAGGAITPGMLVELDSAGDVIAHATAALASRALPAFAREMEVIGSDIDTAYASGDRVVYSVVPPGAEVYAFLDTGENVAAGATLESAGNGHLQATTTGATVAIAKEAVNATAATLRIKVDVV